MLSGLLLQSADIVVSKMHSKKLLKYLHHKLDMKQVLLQDSAVRSIEIYIEQYWLYYYERFHDTGIFGLDEILARYWDESIERKDDIRNTLEKRLSPDIVHGHTP